MGEFVEYNPNPKLNRVGDCTVRALSCALGQDWDDTYLGISIMGFIMKDMPSGNAVWGEYLKKKGYTRHLTHDSECTVECFCRQHKQGVYILALDSHVVCVRNGKYYDSWDSGQEVPLYYWVKEI